MEKYKKYINLIYLVIFVGMVVVAYTTSKYKPESVLVLFTDLSWLGDWPKWLDFPLMPFLNKWFDILIVKYGIMFEGINFFLLGLYGKMKNFLVGLPWPILMISVILLAYFASGKQMGTTIMVAFCVFFLGFLSPRYWDKCIMTTTIVIIGMLLCLVIGIPIGIMMARNKKVRNALLPILDLMQTIPSFCYLIPGILLFGLGAVPAIFAIFVYAVPPLIRLTDLGIRLVDKEVIEAAEAFGASKKQKLLGVQLPLALPNIMQGINQCTMMALAMVVIASMIGVKGLGVPILRAVLNQYLALGLFNGLAIVALAIIFDRAAQEYGRRIQKHRGIKR